MKSLCGARRFVLNAERLLALLRRCGYVSLTDKAEVVQVTTDGLFDVELVVNHAAPDEPLFPTDVTPVRQAVHLPSANDRVARDQEQKHASG